jgi:hypothetical protein
MERDWPEGRGIFHNKDKTFLTWVNEEDQLRIISMQEGGDVRAVFDRLARGIQVCYHSLSIIEPMLRIRIGFLEKKLQFTYPWASSKGLQSYATGEASVLKREHPALQNIKIS